MLWFKIDFWTYSSQKVIASYHKIYFIIRPHFRFQIDWFTSTSKTKKKPQNCLPRKFPCCHLNSNYFRQSQFETLKPKKYTVTLSSSCHIKKERHQNPLWIIHNESSEKRMAKKQTKSRIRKKSHKWNIIQKIRKDNYVEILLNSFGNKGAVAERTRNFFFYIKNENPPIYVTQLKD